MNASRAVWASIAVITSILIGTVIGLVIPESIIGEPAEHLIPQFVASSAFAFASYWAIAVSVVYGLLLSTKLLDRLTHRRVKFEFHRDMAAIGLGLAGIHGTLYMMSLDPHVSITEVLIPGLVGVDPEVVALGQFAIYLLIAAILSWVLRRRVGIMNWRVMHATMIMAFAAATLHSLLTPHEGHNDEWLVWIYSITTSIVVFLILYRLYISLNIFCDKRRARREQERRDTLGLTD